MKKDIKVYILHIRDSIDKIESYTNNVTQLDFNRNTMIQDAVIRQLEIIGEAAKNIPEDFKKKYEDIPWKSMIGMRNKVIHEYFGVQLDIVWEALMTEMPVLKVNINKLVSNMASGTPLGL